MLNRLSVVIITYNMGGLIRKALQSLVDQTRKDFEVIVVDNHSTDDTMDAINEFPQLSIRCLEIFNDGILSKSRNYGIAESNGEWIAFLDADDYWENEKVAVLYDVIDRAPKECVAISHRCYEKDLNKRKRKIVSYSPNNNNLYKYLVTKKNPFCLTGMTVKKNTLLNVGGFSEKPEYKTVEDYELWIRLSKIGQFDYIEKPLATIVLHEGNYSKKADIQMNALHAMKMFYLDSYSNLSAEERKESLLQLYELETRCLQKNGFFNMSKKKYAEAREKDLFSIKLLVIYLLCILKKR